MKADWKERQEFFTELHAMQPDDTLIWKICLGDGQSIHALQQAIKYKMKICKGKLYRTLSHGGKLYIVRVE